MYLAVLNVTTADRHITVISHFAVSHFAVSQFAVSRFLEVLLGLGLELGFGLWVRIRV